MAAPANLLSSYDIGFAAGSGNREDLLDVVVNIEPWDAPLFTAMPKTTATHTTHEWLTDTLAATSTAGAIEADEWAIGAGAMTVRTRRNNRIQTFRKDLGVSNIQLAVNPAGVGNEYSYQVGKALKELARNVEIRIFASAGAGTTGGEATGAVMDSLQDFITTASGGISAPTTASGNGRWANDGFFGGGGTGSATALTEAAFNGELEIIATQGGNPDAVYVPARTKRRISQGFGNANFAGGGRYSISQEEKKIVNSVDVYDSDFGMVKIIYDRWVPAATSTATGDTVGQAFFLESGMVRAAFLRPFRHVPLPPNGDFARAMVLGSLTLEVGNPFALGRIVGITNQV